MSRPLVQLFTDGGCSGNPGPGGWGYILRHVDTGKEKECSDGESETTNNRMELTAVIEGLRSLKTPCDVELVTDSQYVGKGIGQWMPKWKANGWKRKEGRQLKPVKNEDLWRQLDALLADHRVTITWVRGHEGHPENERCDEMAVEAYQRFL